MADRGPRGSVRFGPLVSSVAAAKVSARLSRDHKECEMPFVAAAAGSDPADNKPWAAKWCWTADRLPRPWNTYALFRKSLDLPDRAIAAIVRVSADARFMLFVNG